MSATNACNNQKVQQVEGPNSAKVYPGFKAYDVSLGKYKCPISLEIMQDPVKAKCSHYFERTAILSHLAVTNEKTCPIDRTPLAVEDLTDANLLKAEIDQFERNQNNAERILEHGLRPDASLDEMLAAILRVNDIITGKRREVEDATTQKALGIMDKAIKKNVKLCEQLNREKDVLKRENDFLQEEKQKNERTIVELKEENRNLKEENQRLEDSNQFLNKGIGILKSMADKEKAALRLESERQKKVALETIKKLEQDEQTSKAILAEKDIEIRNLKKEHDKCATKDEKIHDLKKELKREEKQNDKLESKLDRRDDKIEKLKKDKKKLKKKIERRDDKIDSLENRIGKFA